MSLLLDALKKSGDKPGAAGTGLALEDIPPSRTAPASDSAANRSAGETLFAAKHKKKKAPLRWTLGLVPSTLLFALVFGAGYGYYVWVQIQPPQVAVLPPHVTPPPPPAPAVAAPAYATPLVPAMPAQDKPAPVAPEARAASPLPDFDAPRRIRASAHARRPDAVSVQRQEQADTLTPRLLDAYHAYQLGDYASAAQGYREVLNKDARNRDAMLGLAAIALQQGQSETAQQYYRQLLVQDPRDPVALSALLSTAADSGSTESRLKTLLSEQPRSGALNFALGNLYADQSAWGDAQQYYFNAHTLEPANAQYTFNLAVSLDHLGQRKLAAQYYQQALHLDLSGHSGFDRALAQHRLNALTATH